MPSADHPKIFIAQGFDAQDPVGDANWPTGVRASMSYGINSAYPMESQGAGANQHFATAESGFWDGTSFLMVSRPCCSRPRLQLRWMLLRAVAATAASNRTSCPTRRAP